MYPTYISTFRLDIEEGLAEEKKIRDTLNKELEALQKKAKVIDVGVKNAENELEAFQVSYPSRCCVLQVDHNRMTFSFELSGIWINRAFHTWNVGNGEEGFWYMFDLI